MKVTGKKTKVIFDYFVKHKRITQLDAWRLCSYSRLAALINKWRNNGMKITTTIVFDKNGVNYAIYKLIKL